MNCVSHASYKTAYEESVALENEVFSSECEILRLKHMIHCANVMFAAMCSKTIRTLGEPADARDDLSRSQSGLWGPVGTRCVTAQQVVPCDQHHRPSPLCLPHEAVPAILASPDAQYDDRCTNQYCDVEIVQSLSPNNLSSLGALSSLPLQLKVHRSS